MKLGGLGSVELVQEEEWEGAALGCVQEEERRRQKRKRREKITWPVRDCLSERKRGKWAEEEQKIKWVGKRQERGVGHAPWAHAGRKKEKKRKREGVRMSDLLFGLSSLILFIVLDPILDLIWTNRSFFSTFGNSYEMNKKYIKILIW